jgi:adenylosuccinate lyase
MNDLTALSPLDGRYADLTDSLSGFFSEFAFLRDRVRVELDFLSALSETSLTRPFTDSESARIESIISNFSPADAEAIRARERETRHDVKAIEYFLRDKFQGTSLQDYLPWIHFGITSEDVNNIAQAIALRDARDTILLPALDDLLDVIRVFFQSNAVPAHAGAHTRTICRSHNAGQGVCGLPGAAQNGARRDCRA